MSSRIKRTTNEGSQNPATKFMAWKSNDKCFAYYDKEKGENIQVQLTIKILFMEHYHTVKGWNDASESGIYSNEVYSIVNEPMEVKAFKGGTLAKGLYKDIKEQAKNAGGVYHKSIYAMTDEGELINISLKGAAVKSYGDFYNENKHNLLNNWIEINGTDDQKKGSVKFSTPTFELGEAISKKDDKLAAQTAETLQEYIDAYTNKESSSKEPEMEPVGNDPDGDDLEF